MKKLLVLVMVWTIVGWAIPKPMESIQKVTIKTAVPQGGESTKKARKNSGLFQFRGFAYFVSI
jgi:hypothetical protein